MSRTFEGVIVGGPKAGQYLISETDVFRVATTLDAPISPSARPMPDKASYRVNVYRHQTLCGVQMWMYDELYKAGVDDVIKELVRHYRPLV